MVTEYKSISKKTFSITIQKAKDMVSKTRNKENHRVVKFKLKLKVKI